MRVEDIDPKQGSLLASTVSSFDRRQSGEELYRRGLSRPPPSNARQPRPGQPNLLGPLASACRLVRFDYRSVVTPDEARFSPRFWCIPNIGVTPPYISYRYMKFRVRGMDYRLPGTGKTACRGPQKQISGIRTSSDRVNDTPKPGHWTNQTVVGDSSVIWSIIPVSIEVFNKSAQISQTIVDVSVITVSLASADSK